jgi:hypothetical protein
MDVELPLNDAEERNGDGYRKRHAQGGSQETLTAADQSDGTKESAGPSEAALAANSCRKRSPAPRNTKASVVSAANDAVESLAVDELAPLPGEICP